MTVVLYMEECPFCKGKHWTDQDCKGEINSSNKLYGG